MNRHEARHKFRHGFIVAIDGPAGAGKSTVSRQLAVALGGVLLDTGAMYRGVAFYAVLEDARTAKAYGAIAKTLHFDVDKDDAHTLLVNREDLGAKLRSEAVSAKASDVSKYKGVRLVLTRRQRALGRQLSKKIPVVMEGRDIGTVVFPEATFKFYVTARPEVRAERRLAQLRKQGMHGAPLKEVLRQLGARDEQDSTRKLAPLRCAEDAVVVDTSSMGIAQVVRFMADHIRNTMSLRGD